MTTPRPTTPQFVSYGDTTYTVTALHARGCAQGHHLSVEALSPMGEQVAAELPETLPASEPVLDESQRLRRNSPLRAVWDLAEVAERHGLHLLAALTFEAAHIQEDLPLPNRPFLEFMMVDLTRSATATKPDPQRLATARASRPAATLLSDSSPRFHPSFARSREHLLSGDIFEIVLSRQFRFAVDTPSMREFLARTMEHRMAPYRFVLDFPRTSLVGASPELLVRVVGDRVTTRPISGSIRRTASTATLSADELREFESLLASEKEKSELDMLIDLARHDLHRVCTNVTVEQYRQPLILETVAHTQATVCGHLKEGLRPLDALFSCLNAGTLVGAPKRKAMEIIRALEGEERGYYGGNLLHLTPEGDLFATILIRTGFLSEGQLTVQAGATVLLDSNVDFEYWECGAKARSMLEEIGHGELCFTNDAPPAVVSSTVRVDPYFACERSFEDLAAGITATRALSLLLIDNEDSFTFNLAALFERLGCTLTVVRNSHRIDSLAPYDGVLLSPGPSSPREAGLLLDYVRRCAGAKPVFGVCLGLQAMVEALGGELARMPYPLHGKSRAVLCNPQGRFAEGLPPTFNAARYHSLHAVRLPDQLRATARDSDGVILAIEGPEEWPPFVGVQFHPESFLTGETGVRLAQNWLERIATPQPVTPTKGRHP
jgi:anthranilate synthase